MPQARQSARVAAIILTMSMALFWPAPPVLAKKAPLHSAAVRGKRFVAKASWYGREFEKRATASGRAFRSKELTCAHRSLPFGTDLRITNLANGRTVVVRITDRGPYVPGRDLDLSFEAARRLGMLDAGVARVEAELLPKVAERSPIPVALVTSPLGLLRARAVTR